MLTINANLIVVFILIWITLFFLKKLFFDPVQKVRAKRQALMKEQTEAYAKASQQANELAERIEAEIKEARQKAAGRRKALEAEALQARAELISQILAEYRRQVAQAREEIARLTEDLKGQLEAEVENLATKIEERLLN